MRASSRTHWNGSFRPVALRLTACYSAGYMVEKPIVGLRLSPDELSLLDALAAHEERSRSDVVRRAIRAYAEKLGVTVKPAKRPKK
jgi:Ribbon-helix-helix protein, copG family